MNMPVRIATAAAAVAAIAVIGAIAFPRGGGVAAPPTPSPSPSPTPTPTPVAFPVHPQELTVTVPGTYLAGNPFQIPTTLNVPAGWAVKVGGPYAAYLDRAPVEGEHVETRRELLDPGEAVAQHLAAYTFATSGRLAFCTRRRCTIDHPATLGAGHDVRAASERLAARWRAGQPEPARCC